MSDILESLNAAMEMIGPPNPDKVVCVSPSMAEQIRKMLPESPAEQVLGIGRYGIRIRVLNRLSPDAIFMVPRGHPCLGWDDEKAAIYLEAWAMGESMKEASKIV